MVNLLPLFFIHIKQHRQFVLLLGFNPFGTSCGKRGLYFLICLQQKEFYVDSLSTMQLKATRSRKQYREAPCNGPDPVRISH